MVDQSPREDLDASGDELASVPELIADLVADTAIPGIPPPVRRNFLKALGQLCSAAIDIPVAYLTGKADETRAETASRIKLINTSAAQIAEQMKTDPAYARVAVQKFGQRVLREQVNLDLISLRAVRNIGDANGDIDQSESGQSDDVIDDDWLNSFEAEARQKSTEEMQIIFAKVLAGEARRPGSYSARTVKILGSFDQRIARLFLRLRSMCILWQDEDAMVPSLGGDASQNALKEFGLGFSELNLLNEHGLLVSDYNCRLEFRPCASWRGKDSRTICTPWGYQGRYCMLVPVDANSVDKQLRINGPCLTQCGVELLQVVEVEPVDEYSLKLAQWFEDNGFRMGEVDDARARVLDVSVLKREELE